MEFEMMELQDYLVVISVVFVAIGWFVQYRLERRSERLKRHEEIRLKFLIESYETMNHFIHSGIHSQGDALKFQNVMNTMFLLGRRELVEAVKDFNVDPAGSEGSGSAINIGTVVRELRKQVRAELSLDFDEDDPNSMRYSGAFSENWKGEPAHQNVDADKPDPAPPAGDNR